MLILYFNENMNTLNFSCQEKTCEELPVHVFSNLALIIPLCMENGYYDAAALLDN